MSLLLALKAAPQNNIAHVTVWRPKDNNIANFETGYKQHLAWHKLNKDTWDWYGWYVISGTRYGCFIDASFNHSWGDFDKPIRPAEDIADNRLHVFPFGELQTVYKSVHYKDLSFGSIDSLKSRFLRLYTVYTSDVNAFKALLKKLSEAYKAKQSGLTIEVFQTIEGGDLSQFQLIVPFNAYSEQSQTDIVADLILAEAALKKKVIDKITSEVLVYRPDMSYFKNDSK